MLRILQHDTLEEASKDLLGFATLPMNWVAVEDSAENDNVVEDQASLVPSLVGHAYQRKVGTLRVCASVQVDPMLLTHLHISFREPGLTPVAASDHLASFLRAWMPLIPNCEWEVESDGRWVHFRRPYQGPSLRA